jgi:pyridoxine 5-phosphate synthase
LAKLKNMTQFALKSGLEVNMGHGLNYRNVRYIAEIEGVWELNIGHAIVGRALLVGFERAVKEMLERVRNP